MALTHFQLLVSAVLMLSVFTTISALSCGTCIPENCPVLSCPGGLVDDVCGCCKQCAKQPGQSCGGKFNKHGQCDKGSVCERIVESGGSVRSDVPGICSDFEDDTSSSFTETCEIKSFSGCNIVAEECGCSSEARACVNPFQFADLAECRAAVSTVKGLLAEPTPADCSQARCDIVFDIQCPSDSLKIQARRVAGECCPQPPECQCNMAVCHSIPCPEGYEYHQLRAGNGQPGSCCDTFECRPNLNVTNCHGVVCPETNVQMCPADSKAVMGGMSTDGCCILPSKCTCALERCAIPLCTDGYSPRRIASGSMEPGSCCDVYECVIGMVTDGCTHNGHTYADEEAWSDGHCMTCRCEAGWAHCIKQQDCNAEETQLCLTSQGIKTPGERWDENDCTMCECVGGNAACMTSSCVVKCLNPRKVDGICCPVCDTVTNFITMNPVGCPPFNCTLHCSHGYVRDDNDCHVCQCLPEIDTPSASSAATVATLPTTRATVTMASGKMQPTTTPSRSRSTTAPWVVVCPLIDCATTCYNGFKTDESGCFTCECRTESPDCPDMSGCQRDCAYGYRQDEHGCDTCRCQTCKPMDSCTKSCLYGYQTSRHGCLKCKCNKCPSLSDCKKSCPHGFEVNDRGCQICKCQASSTVTETKPPTVTQGSCQSVDRRTYEDGESWHDGCRQCYCSNGQEMCGLITCPVPACSKPVIRLGHCCPTCPDEPMTQQPDVSTQVCHSAGGQYYVEGENWMIGSCTSCLCHNGQVLCSPEVCPPLPCLNPVFKGSKCCAECEEAPPDLMPLPGDTLEESCMMPGGVTFQSGATWKEDSCTSCQCVGGASRCFSQTCPPVDCDKPLLKKGQCCPTCLDPEIRHICMLEGNVYIDQERWQLDNCTTCVCEEGDIACTSPVCPELACKHPVFDIGKCCPFCPDEGLQHSTKSPTKVSPTDKKDFEATEPVPKTEKPKTHKPLMPNLSLQNKDTNKSDPPEDSMTTKATQHRPLTVYPIVMAILGILLAVCIVLLLLLFVTKRRHRLLYHVNVKSVDAKGHVPIAGVAAAKTKNMDARNSKRDSIRDSAVFKDNLPTKASVNVTLDSQELKRYSDMFAVGKSIQPV
ncbi:cysteine-rich motor neuron 1 protein-like [Diadema antillarum]|uniref:cysteine-rich motor neuron 1 protein-like n=1 Tax=Diadema antillarum TaxID=105358 RepID=UPI003A8BB324